MESERPLFAGPAVGPELLSGPGRQASWAAPSGPVTDVSKRRGRGWSARWTFHRAGRFATSYDDQSKNSGWGIGPTIHKPIFEAARWHHVAFEVRPNVRGEANGAAPNRIGSREVMPANASRSRDPSSRVSNSDPSFQPLPWRRKSEVDAGLRREARNCLRPARQLSRPRPPPLHLAAH